MTDFFISYTSADKEWAEWIGYVLEEERYSVILQAWDFRPGSNFVLEMQDAAKKAARTIMVLSPDYMKSQFASSEWAAAFKNDPQGLKRKLVPVIVQSCELEGLLAQIVHINLVDLDQSAARDQLISGVRSERAKPTSRPAFPGKSETRERDFPGGSSSKGIQSAARPYMPKIKRVASDIERRRFSKDAFTTIHDYFEHALPELARHTRELQFDFQSLTALDFTAEIFIEGKSVAACRIRHGGDSFSRDGITYAEGRDTSSNSANEILTLTEEAGEPALASLMGGFGYGGETAGRDLKCMTATQAAEYISGVGSLIGSNPEAPLWK